MAIDFAKRISRIQPSATLKMTAKAAELRAQGLDVINLSVGEPDFPTPENVREAGIYAINNGFTHYTATGGMPDLRKAVCEKLERDNDLKFDPSEVIINSGGKHSLFNICQALFETGDEVIVFAPYWVSFPDFVTITGANRVIVDTDASSQFEPIMDDLLAKLSSKTKGIIINSPSNPTGGVWSDETLRTVLELAHKHDLWVIADECYEQFVYDGEFTSFAKFSPNPAKVITVQSVSKTYSMTGWRIGYAACDPALVKAMTKIQGQSTSCPTSIAQYASIEALTGDQNSVPTMRDAFRKRRDFIVPRLNEMDGISCDMPRGAFYAFPDVSAYIGKSFDGRKIENPTDLSLLLLDQERVVSVAGEGFGSTKHIRFSYAAKDEELVLAMNKFESLLKKLN